MFYSGSRTQYNTLTGVLDGNTVYGVTDDFGRWVNLQIILKTLIRGTATVNPEVTGSSN